MVDEYLNIMCDEETLPVHAENLARYARSCYESFERSGFCHEDSMTLTMTVMGSLKQNTDKNHGSG